ncbi:hypothetical protein ACHBTE_30110 [Streptomyces sp. M41]|uniref:hypothetical protein n=1 Tax=Streptomyces sp. M41 TaxID=3059412 RepID=UPI00374CAECC
MMLRALACHNYSPKSFGDAVVVAGGVPEECLSGGSWRIHDRTVADFQGKRMGVRVDPQD